MASLDFLTPFPVGDASLSIVASDRTFTIHNLSLEIIGRRCPLLELSFEQCASGIPKASIEAASVDLVLYFVRFLYTGDYLSYNAVCVLPFSLLTHAQLCRMAEVFEVPELQALAHTNIIRETELACSLPNPPLDLCPAIQFIYEHLAEQKPLIDTILNYCVCCFLQHGLGLSEPFRRVAFELRPFHQDLCRTSFKRGFQDDGAVDIVRLPVRESTPHPMQELGKLALGDFLHGIGPNEILEHPKEIRAHKHYSMLSEGEYTLVHRPKLADVEGLATFGDEMHDYTLVHLPKNTPQGGSHQNNYNAHAFEYQSRGPSDYVQNGENGGQEEKLEDWNTITVSPTDDSLSSDSEWALV